MILEHVHISYGISKLGVEIPSVNLPVGATCRRDAPCFRKCYARRGRFALSRIKSLLDRNLEIWHSAPAQFEQDVSIAAHRSRFFRWHSTGDILSEEYLRMMIRIAKQLPHTNFLAFTKKHELVNSYIAENGALPSNLAIIFSAWGDQFQPENPYNLPLAHIRFKKQPCHVPDDAIKCPKYCGDCVTTGMSCWDLQPGQSVCFDEH